MRYARLAEGGEALELETLSFFAKPSVATVRFDDISTDVSRPWATFRSITTNQHFYVHHQVCVFLIEFQCF